MGDAVVFTKPMSWELARPKQLMASHWNRKALISQKSTVEGWLQMRVFVSGETHWTKSA